jgi:voltage-gated potassium channel
VGNVSWRRFGYATAALAGVIVGGTIGYQVILGGTWLDDLYRTFAAVSLAGMAPPPEGRAAKLLTIGLIFCGVAIFAYVASTLIEVIAQGVLTGAWAERRLRRMIQHLQDHFIICGFGRVGRRVAEELATAGIPYAVLDFNPEALAVARERGVPLIEGNGTEDADLRRAGLERARGIIAASDSDVDNLYITLSARAARRDLTIVARASDAEAEKKLMLAGADRVVQPYSTAGVEMAKLAYMPQVAAFLDIVSTHVGSGLGFEEVEVTPNCREAGRTIRELRVRRDTGAVVLAVRKADGSFVITPDPDEALDVGDVLIAVGTEDELRRLEQLFAPTGSRSRDDAKRAR